MSGAANYSLNSGTAYIHEDSITHSRDSVRDQKQVLDLAYF